MLTETVGVTLVVADFLLEVGVRVGVGVLDLDALKDGVTEDVIDGDNEAPDGTGEGVLVLVTER